MVCDLELGVLIARIPDILFAEFNSHSQILI